MTHKYELVLGLELSGVGETPPGEKEIERVLRDAKPRWLELIQQHVELGGVLPHVPEGHDYAHPKCTASVISVLKK